MILCTTSLMSSYCSRPWTCMTLKTLIIINTHRKENKCIQKVAYLHAHFVDVSFILCAESTGRTSGRCSWRCCFPLLGFPFSPCRWKSYWNQIVRSRLFRCCLFLTFFDFDLFSSNITARTATNANVG